MGVALLQDSIFIEKKKIAALWRPPNNSLSSPVQSLAKHRCSNDLLDCNLSRGGMFQMLESAVEYCSV